MRCNACRRRYRKVGRQGGYTDISARFVLRRHPDAYVRAPRCPRCRSTDVTSVQHLHERQMAKRKREGRMCRCSAYPFPHDKGGLRMCKHHPLADVEVTQEEWDSYERCLATPRNQWQ